MNELQLARYKALQEAAAEYIASLLEFNEVFETHSVGLVEETEHVEDVLQEIADQIDGE